jgi:predicted metal-dependent HD superfamily phosphohydrolase
MSYEDQLKKNAEKGAELVGKYLDGTVAGSDKIKIASQAITQLCRHQATKGAIDTIKFGIGRSISADAKELRDYVKNQMPEYDPVKRLK